MVKNGIGILDFFFFFLLVPIGPFYSGLSVWCKGSIKGKLVFSGQNNGIARLGGDLPKYPKDKRQSLQ